MIEISVVIPTYNRVSMLSRALASVLASVYPHFECIIVDDGSTDATDAFLATQRDPRIHVIRFSHNRGVSAARNAGVARATGQFVAFLDSDDVWDKKKLKVQHDYLIKNPNVSLCQTKEIWIRNGVRVNPPKTHEKISGDIFLASLARCMITPSSVMLRRELFTQYGGFNEDLRACEDYDLWLRITAHEHVGLIESNLLTRYGGHADQLSASTPVLDSLRVKALANLVTRGRLSNEQMTATKAVLTTKLSILRDGALKRNLAQEVENYDNLRKSCGIW